MFSTSTHKKKWTFDSPAHIDKIRQDITDKYYAVFRPHLDHHHMMKALSVDEQKDYIRMVGHFGSLFAEKFTPKMWLSVKWTAYTYYRRFYLNRMIFDYHPKEVLLTCFYLASKVDEFNVSIEDFVRNIQGGTDEDNRAIIIGMEPKVMVGLNFELAVHCPFRALEGHLLEMKKELLLGFDIDALRPFANDFFHKCLYGDASLLYPPSQISLAAIKFALYQLGNSDLEKNDEILNEFLMKFLSVDEWSSEPGKMLVYNKLAERVKEIYDYVMAIYDAHDTETFDAIVVIIQDWIDVSKDIPSPFRPIEPSEGEDIDSDDD
uniref:CYCLIN domain-containing protein n=1 Tax=Rhabditophanes sp. KR3021 TaxID=114890 RepID=A0AC35TJN1_9BILA